MTVSEATPNAAPLVPGQEEKSWDAQYELPEESKRWYDQLFDNVLLYHFKDDASATQSTDKFAKNSTPERCLGGASMIARCF